MRRLSFLLVAAAAALSGCASPWEQNLVHENWDPSPGVSPPAPVDPARVDLRAVPWERIQATLGELHDEAVRSDQNPAEWPPERKAEAKAKLLRGLQVTDDPSSVVVLGRSAFTSTRLIRPESGDDAGLRKAAAGIGATRAVWSRSLLGTTRSIVNEPVRTESTANVFRRDRASGRLRTSTYTESSTTWVPTQVSESEYGYTAFFLREAGARER